MSKLVFWWPVAAWALVIFFFSSLSVAPASRIFWQDFLVKKTAHLVEYAVFFGLLYRALCNTTGLGRRRAAILSLVVVFVYGASDEYHQSFTPGRRPSPYDVVIDTFGGGVAWVGIWRYLPKMPARLKSLAKSWQIG